MFDIVLAAAITCIPVERGEGGNPIVAARVDSRGPYAFVLDTGSSGTTLDGRRVGELGLISEAPPEQGQGMSGTMSVQSYRVREFSIGPLVLRDFAVVGVPAPSLAGHDVAGLAGVDLFGARMAVWRWRPGCVEIAESGRRPAGRGWHAIKSTWLQPWKVLIPIRIGRVAGWGMLDTGAQKTVLSPGFAKALGLGAGERGESISGLDRTAIALSSHVVGDLRIGRWRFRSKRVTAGPLPLFERLGGSEARLAVIGMDSIGERAFAIDYGAHRVWQAGD